MQQQDLRPLLDFHYWARTRVLDAADQLNPEQWTRDLGSSFPSVRDTAVHTYSAEYVWLHRLQGLSPTAHLLPESYPNATALRADWVEHEAKMRAVVEE